MSAPSTVIVGAGIIGLACAHALLRRGHRVVVLDRHEPASGCSAGNAGWIVPSFSLPVPAPGLTSKALSMLLRRDSAFHLNLRAAPRFASWLWQFWRHCNQRDFSRGVDALAHLNERTFLEFDRLVAAGLEFEQHRQGVLFAFLEDAQLQATRSRLSMLAARGYESPQLLRGEELRNVEPLLGSDVVGGLYLSRERHVRPESLAAALLRALRHDRAEVIPRAAVLDWKVVDNRIVAVHTTRGSIAADHFILAAGVASGELGRRLGLRLSLQAGTGYSITLGAGCVHLRQPVDLVEAGIVCSPFRDAWRIAGTMELSGISPTMSKLRVSALRRGARRYLNLPPDAVEGGEEWMGQRPLTPDGLPLIGRMPHHRNGYVATGHGMLGVTLAPVTAELVADLMTWGHSGADAEAFDPGRFS
jgi:D-amino-acid dehydrogenase